MILQFPSSKQSRTSIHTNQMLGGEYPDLKELLLKLNYSKHMTLLGIYSRVCSHHAGKGRMVQWCIKYFVVLETKNRRCKLGTENARLGHRAPLIEMIFLC